MEFTHIFTCLLFMLVLYYCSMIAMDILAESRAKTAENNKAEEIEIDINDLAKDFEPVMVTRCDIPRRTASNNSGAQIDGSRNFRGPLMTNGILVETLVKNADRIINHDENSDLGNIVAKCERVS